MKKTMQKNLYFNVVFRRHNFLKEFLYNFFFAISSWPRLLLEVFIRKNFGERYFSFSSAITLVVILALGPFFYYLKMSQAYSDFTAWTFFRSYLTWYAFLAAFLYMSVKRRSEIKRLPSVFDFARFSLSAGIIDQRFYNIKLWGKPATARQVATILEPGFCYLIGVGLSLLVQPVGALICQCSILYALSYRAAYHLGDQLVIDQIDRGICNEEWANSFVDGLDASMTRGFSFLGRRPADREHRQRIADAFMEKEEIVEAF